MRSKDWEQEMEREIKRPVSDEERGAVLGHVLSNDTPPDPRKLKRQIRKAMKAARSKELSN